MTRSPDTAHIAQVRSLNRMVTERIGALNEEYLDGGRPLGASRLLWEVGDGADVRQLRARLGLDSGYLSRLLRRLEADGLVEVGASPSDGRVRVVTLTASGQVERARLDRRSDDLAGALLEPLSDRQRARLVEAMDEVERLLTASAVEVHEVDPADPDVARCLRAYFTELSERAATGLDPRAETPSAEDMRPPHGKVLLAYLHGEAIACAGLKHHAGGMSEVKRMWVDPSARGLGLGRRMLGAVEDLARSEGVTRLRLDTNEHLTEAIAMYRSAGYLEIPRYTDEPFATHWFEKSLPSSP